VDGTDGDMLWNGSEEDLDVTSDCEDGDSDTEWYRWIECDTLHVSCVGN
jgi:hypothetical protein